MFAPIRFFIQSWAERTKELTSMVIIPMQTANQRLLVQEKRHRIILTTVRLVRRPRRRQQQNEKKKINRNGHTATCKLYDGCKPHSFIIISLKRVNLGHRPERTILCTIAHAHTINASSIGRIICILIQAKSHKTDSSHHFLFTLINVKKCVCVCGRTISDCHAKGRNEL